MFKFFFISIFLLSFWFNAVSQTSESKVKAELIYRFSQYIEWENEPLIDTFRFGLLTNDSTLISEFEIITKSTTLRSKPIKIFVFDGIANFETMHCIFIDYGFRRHMAEVASLTKRKGVLLITYNTPDLLLTMINIYKPKKEFTLKYVVNKQNLDEDNFVYKPELLLYGGSLVDVKELYISTNKKLNTKNKELDSINLNLIELKEKSAEYKTQIEQMLLHKLTMLQQVNEKELEVARLNSEISIKDSNLSKRNIELQNQKGYRKLLSNKIKDKMDSIVLKESNLKELSILLSEKRDLISENQLLIDEQHLKIETQQKGLLAAIVFTFALIIIVLLVVIALRTKKRLAKRLEYLVDIRTKELNKSKQYYFSIFENSPVSICEFDLSLLVDYLKKNRGKILNNKHDFSLDLVSETVSLIKISDANFKTLELFNAVSKQEFINKYENLFSQESNAGLKSLFTKLLNEEKQFEFEITRKSLKNETKHLMQSFSVLPEDEGKYSKVLVSMLDITDLKMYEHEIIRHRNHLEELIKERTKRIVELNSNLSNANDELQSKNEDLSGKNNLLNKQQDEISDLNNELIETNTQLEEQKEELLNTLSQLKDTQMQLVESEKMASLRMLTAGVAHEINNPINFISSGNQALDMIFDDMWDKIDNFRFLNSDSALELVERVKDFSKEVDNENYKITIKEIIGNIKMGVTRITEIVGSLQKYSSKSEIDTTPFSINDCINDALVILKNRYKYKVEIVRLFGDTPLITSSLGKLNQVFVNVFSNAFDAIINKGVVKVTTAYKKNDDVIEVVVSDNGIGINEDDLNKVFDPFYTTKETGKGTGLGMYISYGIINQLKGSIKFESKVGEGTSVIIELPIKLQ